jgi:signal transduction histidine kinase
LVSNALKFTPAGGRVDLTAGTDRRGSFVLVADTGLGMDAALVSNLFRVGSRTFRPGTAGERGSGFGLLLVNEMLADQGATLEVESSPGRGTRMTVRFPRD